MTKKVKNQHLPYLDGFRGIAALTVLVAHLIPPAWPRGMAKPDWFKTVTEVAAVFAHDAVCLFIVLSGFCLAIPAIAAGGRLRHGVSDFIKRRALRILPPYYAACLLGFILFNLLFTERVGGSFDKTFPITTIGLLSHLTLTHNFVPNYEFSVAYWTIAVEWQIYFFLPVLLWLCRRIGVPWAAATFVLIGCAITLGRPVLPRELNQTIVGSHPIFYGLFALGLAGAFFCFHPAYERWRAQRWDLVALFFGISTYAVSFATDFDRVMRNDLLRQILFGLFAVSLIISCREGRLNGLLSSRVIAGVGVFGYSLYLLHSLAIHGTILISRNLLGGVAYSILFVPLALVLAIGGSYLFHLLAERPIMRYRAQQNQPVPGPTSQAPAPVNP